MVDIVFIINKSLTIIHKPIINYYNIDRLISNVIRISMFCVFILI